jgi:hypothetical protein
MRDVSASPDKITSISPVKSSELAAEWKKALEKARVKRSYIKIKRDTMTRAEYTMYLDRMKIIVANNDHRGYKALSDEIVEKYSTKDDQMVPLDMVTDLRMDAIGKPTGKQIYLRK